MHAALTKGETRALAVIASPRALGMIREAYSPILRNAIQVELAKDLVKLPVHEIEKQLFG
jgi:protein required for attachment to host cells